ncbi:MAG: DUF718 domain-containing protein [Rhizobiales bacterium]|nr:DUF718 domain-containing protein [Hyphomicrobiales bacterium]
MTAYNVVRFKVKPGQEKAFVEAHNNLQNLPGMIDAALIKTGERTYCMVGKWDKFDSIVAARPQMTPILDRIRGLLEDLGGGLGVTDPVSGEVVADFSTRKH